MMINAFHTLQQLHLIKKKLERILERISKSEPWENTTGKECSIH